MKKERLFALILASMTLFAAACRDMNNEDAGTLVGGALGGVLGSQVGKGDGRTAAIIGGTILGAYLGSSVGETMDSMDRRQMNQALEKTKTKEAYSWHNPDSHIHYRVEPVKTYYRQHGQGRHSAHQPCRVFITTAIIGGKAQKIKGRACRQANGLWEMEQ